MNENQNTPPQPQPPGDSPFGMTDEGRKFIAMIRDGLPDYEKLHFGNETSAQPEEP